MTLAASLPATDNKDLINFLTDSSNISQGGDSNLNTVTSDPLRTSRLPNYYSNSGGADTSNLGELANFNKGSAGTSNNKFGELPDYNQPKPIKDNIFPQSDMSDLFNLPIIDDIAINGNDLPSPQSFNDGKAGTDNIDSQFAANAGKHNINPLDFPTIADPKSSKSSDDTNNQSAKDDRDDIKWAVKNQPLDVKWAVKNQNLDPLWAADKLNKN